MRSAMRLRDGLIALAYSPLQGNMRGQKGDEEFRTLLGEHGVVSLGEDQSNSVGRKWRSALEKLGFLYPEIPRSTGINQTDVGTIDTITPSGRRLIDSETVPAMQECFLRALAAQHIESTDTNGNSIWFSPLRHTLTVLLELEKKTGQAAVSFIEMALCVQTSTSFDDMFDIVEDIIALRTERDAAESKRRFDSEKYEIISRIAGLQSATFRDYADANIRYLKATGLVQNKGRGIALVPEKHMISELIAKETTAPTSKLEQYRTLCQGAKLPTDTHDAALDVLNDLLARLEAMGIAYSVGNRPIDTAADIAIISHEIEDIISRRKEEIYAAEQANQWEEIAAYIDLLASRRDRKRLDDETDIVIPRAEAPAYLEWIVWRAFLAINSMENKPYEARRFKIDQDFLPVGTAPGNGPDLIMEFQDFVIVIEVTLTESSRQEALEGEPVRRHVADLVEKYSVEKQKPVYGLFIANRIDSNTAETFRIGVWYTRNDERLNLTIIPMTITQFGEFFKALFAKNQVTPQAVIQLMRECEVYRSTCEAPEWKLNIANVVQQTVKAQNIDVIAQ
ncbi:MAG: AlwI family type II restriction endonuclease [Clostridiales bacterium]|nr:AlwI family type II restriction endonuclease [Clostridiales bacterium]